MGVRGVTDLMMAPGLVNLDFADIRTVMAEMGKAMMGTGEAEGENRAIRAAEAAISNPLLEDTSMAGARGLLINITGGEDMTLFEVDQAANRIREEVADDANIIFGSAVDDSLSGRVRVSVVATGIDTPVQAEAQRPRLVAVGGGAAVAMGQPIQAQPMGMQQTPAVAVPVAQPMPIPAAAMSTAPMHAPEPEPAPMAMAPEPVRPRPTPVPLAARAAPATSAPHPRGLFAAEPAAAPAAPPAARNSLFGIVTGAIRGRGPAPQAAEAPRAEPQMAAHAEPAPAVRPAQTEEMGLDIPAFLRRQSS
jgi:cell division protein FtsZ